MDFRPKSILVPTDYSDSATAALRLAARLAGEFGSRLTVLHADSVEARPEVLFAGGVVLLAPDFVAERRKDLDDYIARHVRDLEVTALFHDDDPTRAILNTMLETGADLVVMGTHGRSGFKRFLTGSIAASILHNATVPVVTVRQWSNFAIRKVVCPEDDSWMARESVRFAADVARSLRTELMVMRFTGPGITGTRRGQVPPDARIVEMELRDPVTEQIAAFAAGAKAGLLVIGSQHHRRGDTTIGASTYDLVGRASCPVLTLNSLAAATLLEDAAAPAGSAEFA